MRVPVKGVGFDRVTLAEAADAAEALIKAPGGHYVVTPNPEIVWLARTRQDLAEAVNGADLVIPDGIGIIPEPSGRHLPGSFAAKASGFLFAGSAEPGGKMRQKRI